MSYVDFFTRPQEQTAATDLATLVATHPILRWDIYNKYILWNHPANARLQDIPVFQNLRQVASNQIT